MSRWEILATDDPNKTLGQRHIEAVRKYFLDKGEEPRTCSVEGCYREVLVIKNPYGETIEFDKCIFHVDKENEYWIENYYRDNYESYKKRRDEAIKDDYPFNESFQINWNENFIAQFWELIREFKHIKFIEFYNYNKWGILVEDLNTNFSFLKFSSFIFPEFEKYKTLNLSEDSNSYKKESSSEALIEQSNNTYRFLFSLNFWEDNIEACFKYQTDFREAIFLGDAQFNYIEFKEKVFFENTKFLKKISFYKSVFRKDTYFINTLFLQEASYNKAYFESDAYFKNSYFYDGNFRKSQFRGKAEFEKITLFNSLNFEESIIEGLFYLTNINTPLSNKHIQISLINIREQKNSFILLMFNELKSPNLKITINFPISSQNINLVNSDFSRINSICFTGNIEDIRFINVNWGEISTKRFCPDITNYRKKRDIFRQIKLALDKQENYIDARKFYALEMWAYGKELEHIIEFDIIYPFISLSTFIYFINSTLGTVLLILFNAILFTLLILAPAAILKRFTLLMYAVSLIMGLILILFFNIPIVLQNLPGIIGLFLFLILYLLIMISSLFYMYILIDIIDIFSKKYIKTINDLPELAVFKFYETTSYFGLSWVRPIIILIALASLYGKKETIRSFIYKHLPDSVAAIFYPASKGVNWIAEQIISIIPGIASMQKEIEGFEFITLLYYSFSAYLIYQFVMAIRRKVRR